MRINELRKYPQMIKEKVKTNSSNIDALKIMTSNNFDSLIVLNDDDNVVGILSKDKLISTMLISIYE